MKNNITHKNDKLAHVNDNAHVVYEVQCPRGDKPRMKF